MNSEFSERYNIMDKVTPRNSLLSGRYKRSFAYHTLNARLPVILTGIIDEMAKDKEEIVQKYGEEAREEIKRVVGALSELKYQLQTDKKFKEFTGNEPDKNVWNNFILNLPEGKDSFFTSCWLYAECYMYRKVSSFFEATNTLNDFDYFDKQKNGALETSVDAMNGVLEGIKDLLPGRRTFETILKINLWSNRCDLSLSNGVAVSVQKNLIGVIDSLRSNLLVDDTKAIWETLTAESKPGIQKHVDIVCDNAAIELFTDLVLAEYLIDSGLATTVRFHIKAIPWFVSDVTRKDFHYMLKFMREHKLDNLSNAGNKWTKYLQQGKFTLPEEDEHFWTSPYEFFRMKEACPSLYKTLGTAHLIIFKGDLNYRKLLGDFHWDPTEVFITCIRGFRPTNICTLRTIKADLVCGLDEGVSEELTRKQSNWMLTGEYGVIQFADGTCGCNSMETS